MGGRMPASFADGLLSGLGHPIIGLDHFAAVVAVGCLAAAQRAAPALAIGFVLAMIAGVAGACAGHERAGRAKSWWRCRSSCWARMLLRSRPAAGGRGADACSRWPACCTAMRWAN